MVGVIVAKGVSESCLTYLFFLFIKEDEGRVGAADIGRVFPKALFERLLEADRQLWGIFINKIILNQIINNSILSNSIKENDW